MTKPIKYTESQISEILRQARTTSISDGHDEVSHQ
jgi:hypothetical protein